MSDLLPGFYTSQGHYRESQGVHKNILRLAVGGDDGEDRTLDEMSSHTARPAKTSYLRLQAWDKTAAYYKNSVDELNSMYRGKPEWKDVKGTDTWNSNKEEPRAKYISVQDIKHFRNGGGLDIGLLNATKAFAGGAGGRNYGKSIPR